MHESIRIFISNCAQSKIGRFVFVAYMVYTVSMIAFAWGHFSTVTYPFRFYGERELFELLNWPQITFVRSVRLIFRWQASQLSDTVAAVYIALPWWVYGYIIELIVKRVMETSPAEPLPSVNAFEFGRSEPTAHLTPRTDFDSARASFDPAGQAARRNV